MTAPLEDSGIGIVTCLYRASASSLPGIWEALGIATDFAPSTLVAPLVGVKEFGLGSTLVFRRGDLDAIGGFAAFQDIAYGLTGPLAGLLADRAGYSRVYLIGAIGAAAGLALAIWLRRRQERAAI